MTTAFRTLLAAAVAGSLGLGASMASADVDVYAEVDKTKVVFVDVNVDIDKDVDLFVQESIYTDGAAEQLILKNQRNQYNFVEDENGSRLAGADVTATWTGIGPDTVATNSNGVAIFIIDGAVGGQSYELCVDDVDATGYTYDPGANVETCDSMTFPN